MCKTIVSKTCFCVVFHNNDEHHMARLIEIAQKYEATVISVEEISHEQASSYAMVTPGLFLTDDLMEVMDIVEKPSSTETSFCLAQIGRHVFSYDIFESLKVIEPGANGEYQLTDAVRHMIQNGKKVLAYKIHGRRYDIGNIKGLLRATISLGLHNPLYRDLICATFQKEMARFSL